MTIHTMQNDASSDRHSACFCTAVERTVCLPCDRKILNCADSNALSCGNHHCMQCRQRLALSIKPKLHTVHYSKTALYSMSTSTHSRSKSWNTRVEKQSIWHVSGIQRCKASKQQHCQTACKHDADAAGDALDVCYAHLLQHVRLAIRGL